MLVTPRPPCAQVPVNMLLRKADSMFLEDLGAPRAFAKDGATAEKTNELLENATAAIDLLFKQRGYDPKKPDVVKAKLGYALDRYEAAAYLVTGAMHLPLLSQPEAWTIGKRIKNIIGESGPIGSKLKALRKRGKAAAAQVTALLHAQSTLNLTPPPHKGAAPSAPPPPPPAPPLPPPLPRTEQPCTRTVAAAATPLHFAEAVWCAGRSRLGARRRARRWLEARLARRARSSTH